MSYRDKYSSSGGDSRRHGSSRRDSPPRHRSRRSPSPGPSRARSPRPRDPKSLPENFGRMQGTIAADDDLNVMQRMKTSYVNSPLNDLYNCVREKKKVKIWTRNYKEVRGLLQGYVSAFDKHWNLILNDVDEVYLKPKKSKTPFLRDLEPNETLPDFPPKVPRQKKSSEAAKAAEAAKVAEPAIKKEKTDETDKKKQRKKSKKTSEKRNIGMLFVRGDNIVMICPLDDVETEGDGDGDEEEEENRQSG